MDFQAVVKPRHLGPAEGKYEIFVWQSQYHSFTLKMCPHSIKNFPDRSRITGSLLQKTWWNRGWDVYFSVRVWGISPQEQHSQKVVLKWPFKQTLSTCVFTLFKVLGKLCSFQLGENKENVISGFCLSGDCQDSQMLELSLHRGPNFQVQYSIFPYFWPYQAHS